MNTAKVVPFRPRREVSETPTVYAPPHPPKAICPRCKCEIDEKTHGFMREYDQYGRVQVIACPMCTGDVTAKRHAALVASLFTNANIPGPCERWTFSTFPRDADQLAKARVNAFINESLAGVGKKRGLYLVGERGIGKTGLALSALQRVLLERETGVYIPTIDLFQHLRESIGAAKRLERGDMDAEDKFLRSRGARLLRLVKEVKWLVLDDLGVECGTKYVIQQLYAIIEARRGEGLYTIFTGNRDASDLEQYWKSDVPGEGAFLDGLRIIDRIGEYCLSVHVAGRNQRERAREA